METEQERLRASGKYLMLSRILEKLHRTGHRVLLFSQMVRALEIVQDMLEAAGYKFLRLDGKTKVRAAALPQKPPPPSCCLVTTRRRREVAARTVAGFSYGSERESGREGVE